MGNTRGLFFFLVLFEGLGRVMWRVGIQGYSCARCNGGDGNVGT